MNTVAALFVRADSIYRGIPGVDCYDIDRDARTFPGGMPVVTHPPCRAWGQLSHLAKPRPDEKDLARFAVRMVRENGGVLEHPAMSRLWADQNLPEPGRVDDFGGWTLAAPQFWWGHNANKATRFYIVGCAARNAPAVPFVFGEAPFLLTHNAACARKKRAGIPVKPECKREEREATPPALAHWLVELARRCTNPAPAACDDGRTHLNARQSL